MKCNSIIEIASNFYFLLKCRQLPNKNKRKKANQQRENNNPPSANQVGDQFRNALAQQGNLLVAVDKEQQFGITYSAPLSRPPNWWPPNETFISKAHHLPETIDRTDTTKRCAFVLCGRLHSLTQALILVDK